MNNDDFTNLSGYTEYNSKVRVESKDQSRIKINDVIVFQVSQMNFVKLVQINFLKF